MFRAGGWHCQWTTMDLTDCLWVSSRSSDQLRRRRSSRIWTCCSLEQWRLADRSWLRAAYRSRTGTAKLSDAGNKTHHGAELELDPLRHAEPVKFVAQNVSQSTVVFLCYIWWTVVICWHAVMCCSTEITVLYNSLTLTSTILILSHTRGYNEARLVQYRNRLLVIFVKFLKIYGQPCR